MHLLSGHVKLHLPVKLSFTFLKKYEWGSTVRFCGKGEFKITKGRTKFVVHLINKTYDSKFKETTNVLCKHAIRCIKFMA